MTQQRMRFLILKSAPVLVQEDGFMWSFTQKAGDLLVILSVIKITFLNVNV